MRRSCRATRRVRLGLFGCLVADWFGRLVAVGCLRRCCLRARFLGRFVAEVGCVPCSVGGGRWFPVVLVVVVGMVGGSFWPSCRSLLVICCDCLALSAQVGC